MRIAGTVLAGGQSRRFGSDKAAAAFRGRSLLDHAILALRPHCALVLVSGRFHPALPLATDRPDRGFGPLGGLAGAMQRAHALGYSGHYSIDSTTVRAHVSAAGGKGGLIDALLAARGAGSPVSFTVWLTPEDDHSPST